jgi:hypothetical protein
MGSTNLGQLKGQSYFDPKGKVHAIRIGVGYVVLLCTGRAVSGMGTVAPETEITCRACKRRGY